LRIAVGAIFTECNHLVGTMMDISCFERTELRRGEEVLAASEGVLGGGLANLRERGAEIVPLLFASAVPGGPLALDCYLTLKEELLERLRAALPVDGVFVPLHGGAAVEEIGDLDGDLLAAIRGVVGETVPVVATLDCHAHVTPSMVQSADALLAWETYPHRDTFATGVRGTKMLLDIVEGRVRPRMAMAKVPVIVGGFMGSTDDGPFAEFMQAAKAMEGRDGVISTSAFLVQPHLDLPGMGGGGLVITDGDMEFAVRRATELAWMYWERRFALEPPVYAPAEAIALGLTAKGGPVLLLEASDCAGGGAAGDSVHALRSLLATGLAERSVAPVVDAEAAEVCHRHSVGDLITVTLGHKIDPRWGAPLEVTGRICGLSDGRFVYSGGIWGGQVAEMGPSAWIRVGGTVDVLVMTHATYDWADEQFRSMGMDTTGAKFVVVKNPMNYRVGYAGKFTRAILLDTPGPTVASLKKVPFRSLQRPYFPVDTEISGLQPTVLRGR